MQVCKLRVHSKRCSSDGSSRCHAAIGMAGHEPYGTSTNKQLMAPDTAPCTAVQYCVA
jgi:hypothetical protein